MNNITYFTFFISTLAILNPLSKVPILLSLGEGHSEKKLKNIAFITAITVFIILIISLWIGSFLLKAFDISIGAFTTAGGIIVFLIGLQLMQINLHSTPPKISIRKESIAVVPLAIPLIAGPGTIATVILHEYHVQSILERLCLSLLCFILALIVWLCLHFASFLNKNLGQDILAIISRLMGLITSVIGVQLANTGVHLLFP
ncbi:Multiple antibiotic resistance (MarC)-related protein [Legionella busanensis]|uniref:UPF0056 membrane protein n=1 Tax=Legionella busanensis TaxID=190655 RepID=A0A378JMK0_9GAMM|nr:MarC family protein [Legionella busanensis]STX51533.1 Multiple antibiotic resistance (MarC)-related protein [Legionella busanensis]